MANLLIVDDDPVIRGMFARTLQPLGDVDQAQSGAEALRALATKRYDVVLLDLHMPVVDGFVVLHMLGTKAGPNQTTPVFLITADTSERARIEALRRKAVFFLTKPVHLATLTALVDGAIKKGAKSMTPPARQGSRPDFDLPPTKPMPASGLPPFARPTPPPGTIPMARPTPAHAPTPPIAKPPTMPPDRKWMPTAPRAPAPTPPTPTPGKKIP